MTKRFDELFNRVLVENTPAELLDTYGGTSEKISKKVEELPGKSQHWGPLQKLGFESRKAIIDSIIKRVFKDNDDNTYSLTIDNEEQLKDAIKSAIKETAEHNPEFKATGKWAIQFLADRLANKELLGNVKYTSTEGREIIRDKDITQKEVKKKLDKAILQADSDVENLETTDSEDIDSKQLSQSSVEFSPHVEYYFNKYEELPAGTLKGDIRTAYQRLADYFSGDTFTGKEFVNHFGKFGFGLKEVKSFIKLGILEPQDEDLKIGDTEGFEKSEHDYINDMISGAKKDWEESSGYRPDYN